MFEFQEFNIRLKGEQSVFPLNDQSPNYMLVLYVAAKSRTTIFNQFERLIASYLVVTNISMLALPL